MMADPNVALFGEADFKDEVELSDKIKSVTWLDDGSEVAFKQEDGRVEITTVPFNYGRHLVVRVAKIECEKCS